MRKVFACLFIFIFITIVNAKRTNAWCGYGLHPETGCMFMELLEYRLSDGWGPMLESSGGGVCESGVGLDRYGFNNNCPCLDENSLDPAADLPTFANMFSNNYMDVSYDTERDCYQLGEKCYSCNGVPVEEEEEEECIDCMGNHCLVSVPFGSTANYMSGNLFHDQTLLKPDFTIAYNSLDSTSGVFGKVWTHNYNMSVTESPAGSLILTEEDGDKVYFRDDGTGIYFANEQTGNQSSIIINQDEYQLTKKDGSIYNFDLASGKLLEIIDRNNNTTSLSYTDGNLASITDPDGRIIILIYDAEDRIIEVTDPLNRTTFIDYDVNGNLSSTTDPQGSSWSYTYDADGRMLTKTDPESHSTTYEYDNDKRIISSTNEYGTKSIDYDSENNTATITERDGGVWTYIYDPSLSVPLEVTGPEGQVTTYTYDQNRNRVSETDQLGNTTSYTYDNDGNMLSTTDPEGNTTAYTYNAYGQTTSITDPAGHTTLYEYDDDGNLNSFTDASGAITSYEYDESGNVTKITNSSGQITSFAYDAENNLTSLTDPTGAITTFNYDEIGNMVSQTDSAGNVTTFEYDDLNRLITVTDANGKTTTYTYDSRGNKISETDANGNTTLFEYDQKNNLIRVTDALESVTDYSYESGVCPSCGNSGGGNNLTSITDANNNTTDFHYDYLGRLISETDPLGNVVSYTYDAKGNLITKTDASNNTIIYTYDSLNRLIQKTYPDASTESFTYDLKGNIITAGNSNISYTFTYDVNNRITTVIDSNSRTISYEYDDLGNRTSMTSPSGDSVTYNYDEANRLEQVGSFAGNFGFAYDSLGRRTSLSFPNEITTTYEYDALSRLTNLTTNNKKQKTLYYTYDNVGNRLTKSETRKHHKKNSNHTYQYDEIYRLLSASMSPASGSRPHKRVKDTEVYSYDPVGNRLTGPKNRDSSIFNNGNQLLTDRKHQYTYDNNGNLTKKVKHHKTWTYEYDYENRLIKVIKTKDVDKKIVSFKYDPFGRRVEKKVEKLEDSEVEKTKTYTYIYDNEDIILEYLTKTRTKKGVTKTKSETTRYVHGSGIDEPLAIEQKSKTFYYHADGLGSITALTNHKRKVVQQYEYDSFGNMKRKGGKVKQPYTYTGREWDKETGLYYYRARYYDAEVGRFISSDPIGFAGGDVNLFAYVQNDPVNWIDPWGLLNVAPEFSGSGSNSKYYAPYYEGMYTEPSSSVLAKIIAKHAANAFLSSLSKVNLD